MSEQSQEKKPTVEKPKQEIRINDILLGSLERPALKWMAERLPAWVMPDPMTVLGVIASLLVLFAYTMAGRGELKGNPWLHVASLGFFLNWVGDSLDGTLARYRHIERPNYGFFIDHSVDGITATAMFLGLGFAHISSFEMGAMGLVGYLLAMIHTYLKTHVTGVFEMTSMKLGPTEIRLIAIMVNTYIFFAGNPTVNTPLFGVQTVGTIVLGCIALILGIYFLVQTIQVGRRLAAQDEQALAKRQAKAERKAEKVRIKTVKKAEKGKKTVSHINGMNS